MTRIALFTVLLAIFCGYLLVLPARAEESPYDIKGVQADALAESSVKARNKAFMDAQRKAFMALSSSYVSPEELATIKPPADDVLSGMIQDFQIKNEQLSTKRYRGEFDFRFKPAAVNAYFGHGPINYKDEQKQGTAKMLLLPYYQEGTNKAVFDKARNPYWSSLLSGLPADGVIILPEGSISDMTDINEVDPLQLSATTLRRLKARYEVSDIAIALARVDAAQPQTVRVEFFKADGYSIGVANTIDTTPKKIAEDTFANARSLAVIPAEPQVSEEKTTEIPVSEINIRPFIPKDRQMSEQLRQRLAMIERSRAGENRTAERRPTTLSGLAAEQAAQSAVASQSNVKVFFNSMTEWLDIQKDIRKADAFTNLRITSLKTNQVDIIVSYSDWGRFINSLSAMGMALEKQADNSFILKRQSGQAF